MNRKKFVLAATGRSGSTLLADLLRSHPDIQCDDELLDHSAWPSWKRPLLWLLRVEPFPYLQAKAHRANRQAYGFKLKTGGQVLRLEHTLMTLHRLGWRLVYLRRADALAQTFSWSVAQVSGHWHTRAGQSKTARPDSLTLDSRIFMQNLRTCLDDRQTLAKMMGNLPHLRLEYEQDLQNPAQWPATGARLCEFIGVRPAPLASALSKTWERPYAEIVSNYADLVAAVAASPLAGRLEQE